MAIKQAFRFRNPPVFTGVNHWFVYSNNDKPKNGTIRPSRRNYEWYVFSDSGTSLEQTGIKQQMVDDNILADAVWFFHKLRGSCDCGHYRSR